MIKVVCGIVFRNNKVFLCRRNPKNHLGGYWEFPGGKLELNEEPKKALSRELFEELSMTVTSIEYFATNIHHYDNFTIELMAFTCNFSESNFNFIAHDKYEWLFLDQIESKRISPADIPILNRLLNNKNY